MPVDRLYHHHFEDRKPHTFTIVEVGTSDLLLIERSRDKYWLLAPSFTLSRTLDRIVRLRKLSSAVGLTIVGHAHSSSRMNWEVK